MSVFIDSDRIGEHHELCMAPIINLCIGIYLQNEIILLQKYSRSFIKIIGAEILGAVCSEIFLRF